jgi:predicted NAD/FAD-binding protein
MQGLERLSRLHQQADRRIWFCGSYAAHGIPLLESAAKSALAVAERLGSRRR